MAGGEKCETGDNDFAGKSQRAEHHHQATGTARNRDAMFHAKALGDGRFQTGYESGVGEEPILIRGLIFLYDVLEVRQSRSHERKALFKGTSLAVKRDRGT